MEGKLLIQTKNLTESLGKWAIRNTKKARWLFIGFEATRLCIAFYLGKSLLLRFGVNEFLPISILVISFAFVGLSGSWKRSNFKTYFRKGLLLMACSWILAFSFGSLFSDSQLSNSGNASYSTDIQNMPEKGLLKRTVNNHHPSLKLNVEKEPKQPDSKNRKLLYLGLFLISLPLTYFGLILGCNLSCAGYAVFSWLAILFSFGFFAGGIYFLLKSLSRKKVIPYRQLDKSGRWKAWKGFLLTWGIVTASAFLFLLIVNLASQ